MSVATLSAPADSVGVGLGDLHARKSGELIAYSLGSCVAVCLYDPVARVSGMAHVVLPAAPEAGPGKTPGKFGDTVVPALLAAVRAVGGQPGRLVCKIAGGAAVLTLGGGGSLPKIGDRNVESVRAALAAARITVRSADTGGSVGRTVRMDAATGRITVRTVRGVETEL